MSWTEVGDDSTTWTEVGKDNGYVALDYVVNFYIDSDERFSVISAEDNTWAEV